MENIEMYLQRFERCNVKEKGDIWQRFNMQLFIDEGKFVIPLFIYTGIRTHGKDSAPRIKELGVYGNILPDIDVSENGSRIYVESKYKDRSHKYNEYPHLGHTQAIDVRKAEKYLEAQQKTGMPIQVWLYEYDCGATLTMWLTEGLCKSAQPHTMRNGSKVLLFARQLFDETTKDYQDSFRKFIVHYFKMKDLTAGEIRINPYVTVTKPSAEGDLAITASKELRKFFLNDKCGIIESSDYDGIYRKAQLVGPGITYDLPAFDICKNGNHKWAHIFGKTDAMYPDDSNRIKQGINYHSWKSFGHVERITGTTTYICIYEKTSGDILYNTIDKLRDDKSVSNDRKMVYFPRSNFRILGNVNNSTPFESFM